IQASTNAASAGFFANNTVLSTTGNITSGAATVTNLAATTNIAVGQYVGDSLGNIPAGTTVLSVTPSATVLVATGSTTAGSTSVTAMSATTGIAIGQFVSGAGIQSGTTVA